MDLRSEKKKILIVLVLLALWFSSLYVTYSLMEKTEREKELKGWIVRVGDSVKYEIHVNVNSSVHTFLDEIAAEYHFSFYPENIFGLREFWIRITYIPEIDNFSKIVEAVNSFSGPVLIEQKIGDVWENKSKIILPFFVPVGYWHDLANIWRNLIDNGSLTYFEKRSVNEHIYKVYIVENNTVKSYEFCWNGFNGVLSAIHLNVSKSGERDSISLILSGQRLSYENSPLYVIRATFAEFLIMALIVGDIGPPIFILYVIFKQGKGREEEKMGIHETPSEIEIESYMHAYVFIWLAANLTSGVIGFLTFNCLIFFELFSFMKILFIMFIVIAMGAVVEFFEIRVMKIRDEFFGVQIGICFVSFALGLFNAFMFEILRNSVRLPLLMVIFFVLLAVEAVIYIIISPRKIVESAVSKHGSTR